jgi:adenylate kinase family enzyme
MRIFLSGGPGAGKTTVTRWLAREYGMPVFELDDIQFVRKFSRQRSIEERKRLLARIVKRKHWIIEGSQTGWTQEAAASCDYLVRLQTPLPVQLLRITKRWLQKFFTSRSEPFSGLLRMWHYAWIYEDPNEAFLREYKELELLAKGRVITIRTLADQWRFFRRMLREHQRRAGASREEAALLSPMALGKAGVRR